MTAAAASVAFAAAGPVLRRGPELPVAALLLGRPVAEAVALLPRLFNLCPVAQGMAARLSLGLPAAGDLRGEVIRDHVLKLCVLLPRVLGLAPLPVPADPAVLIAGRGGRGRGSFGAGGFGADALGPDALGPDALGPGALGPGARDGAQGAGPLAPLVARIAEAFAPGEACTDPLPPPPDPLAEGAFENSAAGRQAADPALRAIEARHGRGPLWRLAGLIADLEAALEGRLPAATVGADGVACVPAARGAYGLRLTAAGGLVTGIRRRTPTDHLLAPGGALLQSLARLPAAKRGLAPLVIALHDPCIPVALCEVQDA